MMVVMRPFPSAAAELCVRLSGLPGRGLYANQHASFGVQDACNVGKQLVPVQNMIARLDAEPAQKAHKVGARTREPLRHFVVVSL